MTSFILAAASSKFVLKIGAQSAAKSIFIGVGKKAVATTIAGPVTYTGGLVMPGALIFGGITGGVKAATKWDTDMSIKYWYKEIDFKLKLKP